MGIVSGIQWSQWPLCDQSKSLKFEQKPEVRKLNKKGMWMLRVARNWATCTSLSNSQCQEMILKEIWKCIAVDVHAISHPFGLIAEHFVVWMEGQYSKPTSPYIKTNTELDSALNLGIQSSVKKLLQKRLKPVKMESWVLREEAVSCPPIPERKQLLM